MNKCIIPEVVGRLGNNLFIIANAYARSMDKNMDMFIVRKQVQYQGNDYSQNIFKDFNFIDSYKDKTDPLILRGYYQSDRHFEKYKDDIKLILIVLYIRETFR